MITKSNLWNFNIGEKYLKENALRTGQKVKWVLLYVRKTQSSVHPLVFYDIKPCIFIPKCHRYILEKVLFQNFQE